jgi:hypothetical protein
VGALFHDKLSDMNSVHEPPRRVLISLPNTNIAISDYLFPGEGPHDAKISLEEMLDIKIHNDADVVDAEGQAGMSCDNSGRCRKRHKRVLSQQI